MRCSSLRNGCSHLNYISFLNCFISPHKWPIIYQQIFCAKNEPLLCGGVLTVKASHCKVLFCCHKHGIKRLNFSKAKKEKHTWHWNCCLQNVECLLKKAESLNFPLPKYFFGRKQLIVIRLVSVFSWGPVTCRCRPDITVQDKSIAAFIAYNMADLHTKYTKHMHLKFYTDNYTQL